MPRRLVRMLVYEFPLIHLTVSMLGNTTFAVGSILFFFQSSKQAGLWLFIIGSFGMLLGSLGEAFVRHERHKRSRGTGSASETTSSRNRARAVLGAH